MGQLRGDETTALLKTQAFSAIPRHSQVFPVVLSCARLCVAVRGSLASEWCRCGAKSKFGWMGVYLGVHPHSDERAWCRRCASITPSTPYHKNLLVVVGLVINNRKCSVELLGKYSTNNLVRKGHLRQRELGISALVESIRKAIRTTYDKDKTLGA